MILEFFTADDISPPLLSKVTEFLDSQDTSHLFQFPQWAVPGSKSVLLRENGCVRWFGTFGMQSPLGSVVPWIRAMVANRGPVCDDPEVWLAAVDELTQQLKRERFTYIDVGPEWVQTPEISRRDTGLSSEWEQNGAERITLRLDLSRSEDEIFSNFRKTSRYEVRRAERLGVSVVFASSDTQIDEFLRLYVRLAERKGFLTGSLHHTRDLIRWLVNAKSRGALLLAYTEGAARGGVVIGQAGRRCYYVWGASEKLERLDVGHILQWRALCWAKSQGSAEYDFGGYTPGATSGPAWFKAGFGGRIVSFVPSYRRVLRRGCYRMLNAVSRMRSISGGR